MATHKEQETELEKLQAQKLKEIDTSQFKFHRLEVDNALKELDVNPKTGLQANQVNVRLQKYGPNELAKDDDPTLWERIMEQFKDQLVQILLASAFITFIFACLEEDGGFAAFVEPFVIMTILIANGIVAIYQDSNADSALEALMEMTAQQCRVLREGQWSEIDTKELVPGDIVEVRVGDISPADLRIIEIKSISLMAEQAALTGESDSVKKTIKAMGSDAKMLQDQHNILFSSTKITSGHAIGIVAYTGMKTAIGCVKEEVDKAKNEEADTPLKQKLDQFSDQLAKIIFIICGLVWAMNFFKFSDPIHGGFVKGCIYYFKIAVALAVAAIPEGLPAVITTCLALGTRKMAKNNCIVRKLPSVETLGCTSTICSDKTGTLTKNLMCAVRFGVFGESSNNIIDFDVEEKSYNPNAEVKQLNQSIYDGNKNFQHMTMVCALNNRARIEKSEDRFKINGEPTEAALIVLAEKIAKYESRNVDHSKHPMGNCDFYTKNYEKVCTLDFSSDRKMMSTVVKGGPNQNWVLLKGAPERVLNNCDSFMHSNGTAQKFKNDKEKDQVLQKIKEEAGRGYRVLGIAIAKDGGKMGHINASNLASELSDPAKYVQLESGCSFVGYVCIRDPPRDEVKDSIQACRTAGINVIMITGDAKETAVAIAKELSILHKDQAVEQSCFTGAEFEEMNEQQRKKALAGRSGKVFSRVEPRHKRELVKSLIDMGEIVAMTGDGVNDAPALKQAHIGVAMGITGTEVAKQVSDMVLTDDNFATIVKAVEEGRSIYSNMKAFIRYLISSNIGEVASIFFTAFLGIPEGFNSVQLLWVNLVTDGFPATALGFNPPDKDVMRQQPRKADENLISGWVFIRYMVVGLYVGFATVGIFVYWYTMAETGDGHTLISFQQLSHWSECPTWEGFQVNNFVEGMDFSKDPCKYFTDGKVKASTLSLSVLVMIEMFNAYNALSEDNSLLVVTPLVNPYLIAATVLSTVMHMMIVYVPFFNDVFSIHSMNAHEWFLVLAFALPVNLVDECLKYYGRIKNEKELAARLKNR